MAVRKKKAAKRKAKKKTPRRKPKAGLGKGGRVSLLTPEVQEQICAYLAVGNYIETAAAAVGIDQSTLRRWRKRGRRELERLALEPHTEPSPNELIYLEFCKAAEKAESEAEAKALEVIAAHGWKDWKALAWRLERKSFERWGRRQAIEHSGPDGKPVVVQRLKIGGKVIEF